MNQPLSGCAAVVLGVLALGSPVRAATEDITIPRGTAIDVLVEDALSSRTAKVGDEFRAVLIRALWIDDRLAFPRGTVVEGRVDVVKSRAEGARSGFIGVKFVRIERPGAKVDRVAARLVEFGTKPERVDVVLIGRVVPIDRSVGPSATDERGGEAPDKEAARFQTSETDVEVAAGTLVSLEFGEPVHLSASATNLHAPWQGARVHLLAETISAAQRALRAQGSYQGPIDGAMGTETRQAIIQFQLHRGQIATGDLDPETMRLLGVASAP
jgi:hypothetical protein